MTAVVVDDDLVDGDGRSDVVVDDLTRHVLACGGGDDAVGRDRSARVVVAAHDGALGVAGLRDLTDFMSHAGDHRDRHVLGFGDAVN